MPREDVAAELQLCPCSSMRQLSRFSESPRLRTFDYRGVFAYHVTIVTAARQRVLIANASILIEHLIAAASATEFNILVYTIMPDHLHVLAAATSQESHLIRFVQRFKQATGYAFKQRQGRNLWQRSYHDSVLRRGDDVAQLGHYILGNPVRAGLAVEWEAWPYCGGTLVIDEPGQS